MPSKVLIVEDDADARGLLETLLRYEGYTTFSAGDGREGFSKAKEVLPDLVVTDIMMPNIDGIELIRLLRKEPDFVRTPVVVLTARPKDENPAAREAGANWILQKPVDFQMLFGLLKNFLQVLVFAVLAMPMIGGI